METNTERKKNSKVALIATGITLGVSLSASLFSQAQTSNGSGSSVNKKVVETVCKVNGNIIGYGNDCAEGNACCTSNNCPVL